MFTVQLNDDDDDDDYQIEVHPSMLGCEYLSVFNNELMRKPHDTRYLPKPEYLTWDKENIYGNFVS
jgi:hypothetical protein